MNQNISIAETEWKVMELLWHTPKLTIGEIKAGLSYTGWGESTIKTLVRRLVQKEAILADNTSGQFVYIPLVSEEECKRKETRHFLSRIYHGSVKMLMASLASESKLTEEETKELLRMIEKMEGGNGK